MVRVQRWFYEGAKDSTELSYIKQKTRHQVAPGLPEATEAGHV